jgi:hypothetical protein
MIVVSAKKRAGRMILSSAEVDGVKVDIVLDTGAQASMGNFALRDRLRKRHLRFDYVPVTDEECDRQGAVMAISARSRAIKIGSFDVAELCRSPLPTTMPSTRSSSPTGLPSCLEWTR